ncbi:MAG: peptidoglycan glycosyltransferase [Bacteroidota bacterium]|jgi:penicillin-binding protein 2
MANLDINRDRQYTIMGVFALTALIMLFRAAQLQLVDSSYRRQAEAITIEKDVKYPSRGVIYDRNGALLVYNNPLYDLMVTYKHIDKNMDTMKFCRLLGIDTVTFKANLSKNWATKKFSKSLPFAFQTMIQPEVYARFQESLSEFPGFFVVVRNVRGFPQRNGATMLGYLSEVNEKQITDSLGVYESGDYIGASGLEKQYEYVLRGKKGYSYILKDKLGRLVGPWKNGSADSASTPGTDLVSTIDIKLQALGERLMTGKIGAVVAIEPATGEILAMVSSPTYDPERMSINKGRSEMIKTLMRDSLKPLFDRTCKAEYPPGSIFKPMMGLIAMQQGVWSGSNGTGCAHGFHYGSLTIKCHGHPAAGNMSDAIAHSCNNYFCLVFRSMVDRYGMRSARQGLDTLNSMIYKFGMGRPLGIDFPGEKDGNIPTSKYYDRVYKRDKFWYSTGIVSLGIGQGENQMTSVQMANLGAVIANRGWFITPHLIKEMKNGRKINPKYTEKRSSGIDVPHFESVIDGMRQVIESGTGSNARLDGITICGKTGTSQNPHGADSSVFMAFAPKDDPKIAIAVYVENGGWGNDFAAPISGLMVEQYLKGNIPAHRQGIISRMERSHLAHGSGRGYYVSKAQ